MFKNQAGVFAVHIPYNGGNPAQFGQFMNAERTRYERVVKLSGAKAD